MFIKCLRCLIKYNNLQNSYIMDGIVCLVLVYFKVM